VSDRPPIPARSTFGPVRRAAALPAQARAAAALAAALTAACVPVGPPRGDGGALDAGTPPDGVDRSCTWSGDCVLTEDCCVCDAVNTGYAGTIPGACPDNECYAPQCAAEHVACALCNDNLCVPTVDPAALADSECERNSDCELRTSCCACYGAHHSDTTDPLTCCPEWNCEVDACTATGIVATGCLFTVAGEPGHCGLIGS
jgi:hypothetical protein